MVDWGERRIATHLTTYTDSLETVREKPFICRNAQPLVRLLVSSFSFSPISRPRNQLSPQNISRPTVSSLSAKTTGQPYVWGSWGWRFGMALALVGVGYTHLYLHPRVRQESPYKVSLGVVFGFVANIHNTWLLSGFRRKKKIKKKSHM